MAMKRSATKSSVTASIGPKESGAPRRASIEISVAHGAPAQERADVLVVGAFTDGTLTPGGRAVDEASGGRLRKVLERGDLERAPGSALMLYDLPGVSASRVLVVSLGERERFDDKAWRDALAGVARALDHARAGGAVVTLAEIDLSSRPLA